MHVEMCYVGWQKDQLWIKAGVDASWGGTNVGVELLSGIGAGIGSHFRCTNLGETQQK